MKLRFSRQCFSNPTSIRFGFGMADVHGPRQWQRYFCKHRSVNPALCGPLPELWMLDAFLVDPLPSRRGPEGGLGITAIANEFEILAVGDFVHVHGKSGNLDL